MAEPEPEAAPFCGHCGATRQVVWSPLTEQWLCPGGRAEAAERELARTEHPEGWTNEVRDRVPTWGHTL